MTMKSDKGKKTESKDHKHDSGHVDKKTASKPKKQMEEGEEDDVADEEEEMEIKTAGKKGKHATSVKGKGEEDDGDDAGEDTPDEWEKPVEEEEWDPDFDEFDLPPSNAKKSGGKKNAEADDDFKIDDEFKDLYNDSFEDEEEDDY